MQAFSEQSFYTPSRVQHLSKKALFRIKLSTGYCLVIVRIILINMKSSPSARLGSETSFASECGVEIVWDCGVKTGLDLSCWDDKSLAVGVLASAT